MSTVMTSGVAKDNERQLRDWDGDHGALWAAHADLYDRSLAEYQPALLRVARAAPAERILDVGCGAGQLVVELLRTAPGATALGVDLSTALLDVARGRSADLPVQFQQADAQVHRFGTAQYDLVVSRTGTMFFGDPAAAFTNLASATKPGGRLAMLVWRSLAENEWLREIVEALRVGRDLPLPAPGAPGPFALSDPAVVQSVLADAGWTDVELDAVDRSIWLGHDPDHATSWQLKQSAWLLAGTDEQQRRQATSNLRSLFAAHQTADGVRLGSAAWLVTARRGP